MSARGDRQLAGAQERSERVRRRIVVLKPQPKYSDITPSRNHPPLLSVLTSVSTGLEEFMVALKVSKLGNSLGVALPKEAAAALHVNAGDMLYLTEAPGGFRVTPYDPTF